MTSADYLALATAVIAAVIAPWAFSIFTGRQAKLAKKLQWDRDDEVAEKAAAVAAAALEAQRIVIVRTEQAAKVAAEAAQKALETQQHALTIQKAAIARVDEANATGATEMLKIMEQVNATHALVNSDMTAARELELEAVRDGERFLSERIKLGRKFDQEPSASDEAELAQKRKRIDELEHILAERAAVLVRVEAEQDKDRAAVERSSTRKEEAP